MLQVSEEYGTVIDRRGLIFDPKDFKANTEVGEFHKNIREIEE